jgi:hypothetical protein
VKLQGQVEDAQTYVGHGQRDNEDIGDSVELPITGDDNDDEDIGDETEDNGDGVEDDHDRLHTKSKGPD